jgi:hypothetical protein
VFSNVFTVLHCTDFGYQEIMRQYCGTFHAVQNIHKSRQNFILSKKGAIFKVLLRNEDAYLADLQCCVIEFYLFEEYFVSHSEKREMRLDCDVVIVLNENIALHKHVKRSAQQKKGGMKISREKKHVENSNSTGAVIYNSTRSSRAANGTFKNTSRVNESEWEMIERRLTIQLYVFKHCFLTLCL